MPDNITLSTGTGAGPIIHTDLVVKGTVSGHYQRIKIAFGASGAGGDVHTSNRFPVSATGTIQPVMISGNVDVEGVVAHDSLATGAKPILVAGRARVTEPTAVATGDSSYIWVDLQGRQVTILNHPAQPRSTGTTGHGPRYFRLTATTVATMIAAPGAGQSIHITTLYPSNVGVANTLSVFESGDTATGGKGFRARFASAGGGAIIKYDPPWKLTANRLLAGRLDSTSTGMIVNVHYYVAP